MANELLISLSSIGEILQESPKESPKESSSQALKMVKMGRRAALQAVKQPVL